MRVLVVGSTGYVGHYVCQVLHEAGHFVRALTRNEQHLRDICKNNVDEVFVGEVTDSDTLDGCCDDIDVVVSALGIRHVQREPTVWDVDWAGNMAVIVKAWKAKVKHAIFITVLRGDQKELRDLVPQIEARERVVDELKLDRHKSGLAYTIVRSTTLFNDMNEFFRNARAGTSFRVGSEGGNVKINPIHGLDLANKVGDIVKNLEEFKNKEVDVGGPDTFTWNEILEMAFRISDRPESSAWTIPPAIISLAGAVAKPLNTNFYSMIQTAKMFEGSLGDFVATPYGSHHLQDTWEDLHGGMLVRDDGTRDVVVHSRQVVTREYEVTQEDVNEKAILCWEFKNMFYDINFGVQFKRVGLPTSVEVKPLEREDAHLQKIKGSVKITGPGTFIFTWDNSYSRFRKKSVRYIIRKRYADDDDGEDASKDTTVLKGEMVSANDGEETKLELPEEEDMAVGNKREVGEDRKQESKEEEEEDDNDDEEEDEDIQAVKFLHDE